MFAAGLCEKMPSVKRIARVKTDFTTSSVTLPPILLVLGRNKDVPPVIKYVVGYMVERFHLSMTGSLWRSDQVPSVPSSWSIGPNS